MNQWHNVVRIKAVYNALGALKDQVVFVGGATVALYANTEASEARPTEDVDIVVEISSRIEYARLEQQLRAYGFEPDSASASICRFKVQGILVDVITNDIERTD